MLNEKLQSSSDKQPVKVLEELRATLVYKDRRSSTEPVYVRNLQQSLLGLPAISSAYWSTIFSKIDANSGFW